MKKLIAAVILAAIGTIGCSPTEPGNNNSNQPDTTSQNFVWEKYTFGGGGGSSVLHDVAIINDTDIWAVGEIYVKDSLGNDDPIPFNAVHWDGNKWKLFRIQFHTICGQSSLTPYPAGSIFSFTKDDIWIGMKGDQIVRLKDTTQIQIMCLPTSFTINKIWGGSSSNVYVVGNGGNIYNFDNTGWHRIPSGSVIDIQDIWGEIDPKTNQTIILAVASSRFTGRALNLLKIDGNIVSNIDTTGLPLNLNGVWFDLNKQYYVVGDGIFQKGALTETQWKNKQLEITKYYTFGIRGNSSNDIIVVGAYGEILHYNGKSWKSFIGQTSLSSGNFYSVSVKGNIVTAVGQDGDNAVITIGRRK